MRHRISLACRAAGRVLAVASLGLVIGARPAAAGTMLTLEPSDRSVVMFLARGGQPTYERVIVRLGTDGRYPDAVDDGEQVGDLSAGQGNDRLVHRGLQNGRTYLYAFFAIDSEGRVAAREVAAATPQDTQPPGVVQNLRRVGAR